MRTPIVERFVFNLLLSCPAHQIPFAQFGLGRWTWVNGVDLFENLAEGMGDGGCGTLSRSKRDGFLVS